MEEGGFLLRFNGKEIARCYSVTFDYDEWQYTVNYTKKKELPSNVKNITVEVEYGEINKILNRKNRRA
jgi:hypothetical protein